MLPNELIPTIAANLSVTDAWITSNLIPFLPVTRIRYLLIGNEVLSNTAIKPSWPLIVPAMNNLQKSLKSHHITGIKRSPRLSNSFFRIGKDWIDSGGGSVLAPRLVYGNNVEIQAFAEMYNRPIHIYSYSTEPINIFHGSYDTDTPPVRLSFHHGNHYNSLVDPRRLTIGAGLGFSSLQGTNVDRDQVKAVIKAQQDQQIDNALLAEGRFYSDLELTEKEMERMVMVASRAEYLAEDKLKQQHRESSTSGAEPSSSGARSSHFILEGGRDKSVLPDMVLSSSMQTVLSMGFSYLQVVGAYSIFGDDVDSMVCYLLEMGGSGASSGGTSRRKGKAAE